MCFGVSCLYHKGINAACCNFQRTFFLSYIVCGGYLFDVLGLLDRVYASIAADFVFNVALGTQLNHLCLDGRYLRLHVARMHYVKALLPRWVLFYGRLTYVDNALKFVLF